MLDTNTLNIKRFRSRDALAKDLATSIAGNLMKVQGEASLAVSGGSTPKLMFQELSQQQLNWTRTTISLVDDRCVPADHERSNEKFIRENLMRHAAANAQFLSLQNSKADALESIMPFDVCILGMGTDGHTASFFSEGDTLFEAVDMDNPNPVIYLEAAGAIEPRITLTLPSIISAKRLILHIEGNEKIDVLQEAHSGGPSKDLPIRYVLAARPDIEVYWAP